MSQNSTQEKTEQATPRRIQEARRKGQVARSTDLTGALLLLAMVLMLYFVKESFVTDIQRFMRGIFSELAFIQGSGKSPADVMREAAVFVLGVLAPFMGLSLLVAVGSNLAQVGFLFAPQALKPRDNILNPVAGFKRILSRRSLVELAKSVLKFGLIGGLIFLMIKAKMEELLVLFHSTPGGIYLGIVNFILSVAWWGAVAYLALALLDYLYQRHDYMKNLMMSKQEVKEEHRQTDGDPLVKSRQRELRRQMSLNRIISEVPKATVVITNPTRLAVALRYEQGVTAAPLVVAKGAGRLAGRIREIAMEHNVPVVENKEVARFLYRNVEPEQEIPLEVYQAVAEILALVYRLRARENYRSI